MSTALTRLDERFAAITEQIRAKSEAAQALRDTLNTDEKFDPSAEGFKSEEFDGKVDELKSLQEEISGLNDDADRVKDQRKTLAVNLGVPAAPAGSAGAEGGVQRVQVVNESAPSPGEKAVESEAFKKLVAGGYANSKAPVGSKDLGQVATAEEVKTLLSRGDEGTGARDLVPVETRAPMDFPRRALTILDLVRFTSTNTPLIHQPVKKPHVGNVQSVPENQQKPLVDYEWETLKFTVSVLAQGTKISRQTLSDVPRVRAIVDQLLRTDLAEEVERQILEADGTGDDLTGILETLGVQDFTPEDPQSRIVTLRKAKTKLARYRPNAYVLNPIDFEAIELERDQSGGSSGTGQFLVGSPLGAAVPGLWRTPIVESEIVPEGKYLLGNWSHAEVPVLEGANIRATDSNEDDFFHNRVSLLAETRLGLILADPAAFVTGDFNDPDLESVDPGEGD